jgi:LacI family transcriptional regulator
MTDTPNEPRAGRGNATITDVAALAGVSIKTVSRVMNGEPGVRQPLREHVLSVMAELKYRPKLSARSLAGARSFLIGLLYYDPSAAFVAGVQQGATLRCREAGYHLVVESLHDDAPDISQQVDRMISALQPDGMILTPPLCDNAAVLQALSDSRTPCVRLSPARRFEGMPSVSMDDVHAAQEVTELLADLGHSRIGFIKGAPAQAATRWRHQGFLRGMKARRLGVDPELVVAGAFTFDSGVAAAQQLLQRERRPTAIFASNDDMALAVLATAQQMGLKVPGELSIAGFDDALASSLVWPPLTTVHQPKDEMARAAVDLLVRARTESAADRPAVPDLVLPHTLIQRGSTAPAPAHASTQVPAQAPGHAPAHAPAGPSRRVRAR